MCRLRYGTKVARLWWNREETTAYLQELYERTIYSRLELQNGAAKVPGSTQWAEPRIEADTDLARVYAVAALCMRFNTYKEFEAALNRITVRHLASQLTWRSALVASRPVPGPKTGLGAAERVGSHGLDLSVPDCYRQGVKASIAQ